MSGLGNSIIGVQKSIIKGFGHYHSARIIITELQGLSVAKQVYNYQNDPLLAISMSPLFNSSNFNTVVVVTIYISHFLFSMKHFY